MIPRKSPKYQADVLGGHTEVIRNCLSSLPQGAPAANLANVGLSEFCEAGLLAARRTLAPFRDLVVHVVLECAEEQMAQTDTERPVAVMADLKGARIGAGTEVIGDPMGAVLPVINGESAVGESLVAVNLPAARPQPTGTDFGAVFGQWPVLVDLDPEPPDHTIIKAHQDYPPGVTPPAATNSAGVLCVNYSTYQIADTQP